jgi:hypothetical protein
MLTQQGCGFVRVQDVVGVVALQWCVLFSTPSAGLLVTTQVACHDMQHQGSVVQHGAVHVQIVWNN